MRWLVTLFLLSCTSPEPDKASINKKEVPGGLPCTSSPYYLKIDPKPERWEVWTTRKVGPDTIRYETPLSWIEGKGISIPCNNGEHLSWEIYY
jgi:hypothetical protein